MVRQISVLWQFCPIQNSGSYYVEIREIRTDSSRSILYFCSSDLLFKVFERSFAALLLRSSVLFAAIFALFSNIFHFDTSKTASLRPTNTLLLTIFWPKIRIIIQINSNIFLFRLFTLLRVEF